MTRSIRKFVGVGAGGLGVSITLTLIVTPLLASASPNNAHMIDAHVVGASASAHDTTVLKFGAASLKRSATVRPLKTAALVTFVQHRHHC